MLYFTFPVVLHCHYLLFASSYSFGVHWFAPFYSGGGFSSEAKDFVPLLHSTGISLKISQHGDQYNHNYVQNMLTVDEQLLLNVHRSKQLPPSQSVVVCHSEPGAWSAPTPFYRTADCPPKNALYSIGRAMFETDRLPDGWISRLNFMDEVWVPTEFAKDIFLRNGVAASKLYVVPVPINVDFFQPLVPLLSSVHSSSESSTRPIASVVTMMNTYSNPPTVFLFIGKWEKRKGLDILLPAFYSEFGSYDCPDSSPDAETVGSLNVCRVDAARQINAMLIIVTNAYHSTNKFESEITKLLQKHNITLDGEDVSGDSNVKVAGGSRGKRKHIVLSDLSQRELLWAYSVADATVIPSFGEGWGRPAVESMAMSVPVIATNWSGPTAYLTEENGYPLAVESLVDTEVFAGHKWAKPSVPHLKARMREVVQDKLGSAPRNDSGCFAAGLTMTDASTLSEDSDCKDPTNAFGPLKQRGLQARQDILSKYSQSAMSDTIKSHLDRLQDKLFPTVNSYK